MPKRGKQFFRPGVPQVASWPAVGAALPEVAGYAAEAKALFERMTTPPTEARKAAINSLIVSLKAGGIWAKLDALWILSAANSQAAYLNWVADAYNITVSGTGTFTADVGWAGNGSTGYLDTNFNPSTAGGHFARDSAFFGVYANTAGVSSGSYAGYFDGSKGVTINGHGASDVASFRINQAAAITSNAGTVTSGVGLFGIARSASNSATISKNGLNITTTGTASTALANGNLRLGNFGTATYSTVQFRAAVAGEYLTPTEEAVLYASVARFLAVTPNEAFAQAILQESFGHNRILAEGVPTSRDWSGHGRPGLLVSPGSLVRINPWGVIFRADGNAPSSDVMVKVGDMQLWVLPTSTLTWTLLSSETRPDGLLYVADFDPPTSTGSAPEYSDPPNMLITEITDASTAYHFYVDRVPFDPLTGILVTFSAKLVSKTGVDLSSQVGTLLAQAGCDFKSADGVTIEDSFVGAMAPVTTSLRRYYAGSMTPELWALYPPPAAVTQYTQADAAGRDPDYVP